MNDSQDFGIGDQVRHKWHGDGSVESIDMEDAEAVYIVRFKDGRHAAYGEMLKLVRRAMVGQPAQAAR